MKNRPPDNAKISISALRFFSGSAIKRFYILTKAFTFVIIYKYVYAQFYRKGQQMKEKLGFGIIGCGAAAEVHVKALKELTSDATICGVCDINPEAAKKFAEKNGVFAYSSAEELLADENVDVVNICTPSGFHYLSVVAAARAKKHIICEKPLAINKAQLDEIEKECALSGVTVAVISQYRCFEDVLFAKKAIEDGKLGKIVCADIYMKYYRSQEYYDSGSWRGTKAIDGGGALMNQGIHGLDLLLFLAGNVKKVYALSKTLVRNIEVEDTLSAVCEFENGATGVIQATTSVFPGYPRRLEINGDKGSIAIEESTLTRFETEKGDILKSEHLSGVSPAANFTHVGHKKQIADTIEAIRTGRQPISNLKDGRRAVDLILAIYESAETGKPVEIR